MAGGLEDAGGGRRLVVGLRITGEYLRKTRRREDQIVHLCTADTSSAGVGRTGTFIALSSMLDGARAAPPSPRRGSQNGPYQSPLGPLKVDDVIAQRVDELREHRCMLVQTPQQLALLYHMLGQ